MAKVSLRGYNHEIEGMIENGQLDEAIAHCQHILKTYPMHVETYRLLGKSFLESKRYTDAADIFQRTLMAVPDDFVSHVGMSIIRDDEGKLDDAIWHMERAFEDQPSNPAIQGELRRLYGRRDGVEPSKIRLSRDALANMYSQGELFNQAIAEIRAVLAEDVNRPDLQVMLARAYYRAGRKVEAAEMAANLLKKYTYCMDALRILADVLPGTARSGDTQVYSQRLRMLDPYSSLVTDSTFNSNKVADSAVNLERLEYTEGSTPVTRQPDWASSLGIKMADDKGPGSAPMWINADDTAKHPPAATPASSESEKIPADSGKGVPDWMRSAGWQESSSKQQEGMAEYDSDQSEEPIAKAEIPDWLKSMAPQDMPQEPAGAESSQAPHVSKGETEGPDWLAGLGIAAEEATLETPEPLTYGQDEGAFPDWLKEPGDDTTAGKKAEFPLKEAENFPTQGPSNIPQPAPLSPAAPIPEKPAEGVPLQDEDTPFQPTGVPKPLNIEDDAMGWLENLAAKQGAKEEELLIKPSDRTEEIPEWLRSAGKQQPNPLAEQPAPEPVEPIPSRPLKMDSSESEIRKDQPLEELTPQTPLAEGVDQLKIDNEAMVLQEDISTNQETSSEEILSTPEKPPETPPDWIHELNKESTGPDEEISPETTEKDITISTWLRKKDVEEALGKRQPTPDLSQSATTPTEELPDWLKDLEQPFSTDEKLKTEGKLPEWLNKPSQPTASDMSPQKAPGVSQERDLSAWIDEEIPASELPTTRPTESSPEPEVPTWLDERIPANETPSPTSPGDWIPVDEKLPLDSEPKITPEQLLPEVETTSQPRFPRGTGILSTIPVKERDAELLTAAQDALGANKLNEAMQVYSKLIKKNRLLDEVIQDLREAVYRFPVDTIVWQTLGDASMRANHLQDALDAYTKAEELLR